MELKAIATHATKIKKPNKLQAFDILTELVGDHELPIDEIAKLYSFFMPPIPGKPKTTEQWVGKAMAIKDVRFYLRWYYSDGERLTCTDGHRLHSMPTTLPKGFYDKALNPVEDQGKYPEVARVINLTGRKEYTVLMSSLEVRPYRSPCGFVYEMPHGGVVDKRYWEEAAKGQEVVTYLEANDNMLINFEDGSLAVVMGVRNK